MDKLLEYLMQQGPAWVLLGIHLFVMARKIDGLTAAISTLPEKLGNASPRVAHGNGD